MKEYCGAYLVVEGLTGRKKTRSMRCTTCYHVNDQDSEVCEECFQDLPIVSKGAAEYPYTIGGLRLYKKGDYYRVYIPDTGVVHTEKDFLLQYQEEMKQANSMFDYVAIRFGIPLGV